MQIKAVIEIIVKVHRIIQIYIYSTSRLHNVQRYITSK